MLFHAWLKRWERADKLFTLLSGHDQGIRDHSDATVAGSASQQEAAVKALTANAAEISTFLISANPNSPKDTLAIRRVREMTMFIFVSICGIILFSWPAHFFLKQPDDLPTVRHR